MVQFSGAGSAHPRFFPINLKTSPTYTLHVDGAHPPGFGFASYHSKTETTGGVLSYKRSFDIKDLTVPVNRAADLKKFYRIMASDEKNTAVLKPAGK
jgi:hypothetical protein